MANIHLKYSSSDDKDLNERYRSAINITDAQGECKTSMHLFEKEQKIKWWGGGEWVDEPDVCHFMHNEIQCLIFRVAARDGPKGNHIFGGHLCGYVVIPENCPKWKFEEVPDFDVHGGITFSNIQDHLDKYVIGFDCAHGGDIVPSMKEIINDIYEKCFKWMKKGAAEKFMELNNRVNPRPTYKNIEFVKKECESLADQLNEFANKSHKKDIILEEKSSNPKRDHDRKFLVSEDINEGIRLFEEGCKD